jgi:hypothetical protein
MSCCRASAVQDRLERAQVDGEWADEPQQLLIIDDFLPSAQTLRGHFTSRSACLCFLKVLFRC